jgi:hypothetical protein
MTRYRCSGFGAADAGTLHAVLDIRWKSAAQPVFVHAVCRTTRRHPAPHTKTVGPRVRLCGGATPPMRRFHGDCQLGAVLDRDNTASVVCAEIAFARPPPDLALSAQPDLAIAAQEANRQKKVLGAYCLQQRQARVCRVELYSPLRNAACA